MCILSIESFKRVKLFGALQEYTTKEVAKFLTFGDYLKVQVTREENFNESLSKTRKLIKEELNKFPYGRTSKFQVVCIMLLAASTRRQL